ncbi:MAG: peptidoglycan DD-metalloendopeptidase family protein [Candidatus Liptonbacteria bacterium]|nr:peptidoglycan DD-metalloendopeptidase family protein [Candidatus Liptonbacteria bacterium]
MSKLARGLAVTSLFLVWVTPTTLTLAQTSGDRNGTTPNQVLIETQAYRAEIENRIKDQNAQLEKLNQQLEETQNKLNGARSERISLQKDLETIKNSITQLNLSIKGDQINIQKLTLEIDSLNYDIRDIETATEDKRASVAAVLREIDHNDQVNLMVVILSGKNLAESVSEFQSLANTGSQLGVDINNLEVLKTSKVQKVDEVNNKKKEISSRQKDLETKKLIVQDQQGEKETILENTKNQESVYQKELEDLRKKQDEIDAQISKYEDELRAKFDVSLLPIKRHGVLEWPIKLKQNGGIGIITQHMGEISRLYKGRPHNGLDIGVPVGTAVMAAEDGKVAAVDDNDRSRWRKYQYGKYILIQHGNNLATLYAHLSKQVVTVGQVVKRGDLIGYSGNTGYTTGAHLHFGVYWGASILMKAVPPALGLVPVGVVLNPEDYL